MRWMFLLLLVLNAFYYVWHQQQVPLKAKQVEPMVLYQGGEQGVNLLQDADRSRVRRPVEALPRLSEEVCLFLGSFTQDADAQQLMQRLIAMDIAASVKSLNSAAGQDYWVYLEPLASRQASLRQLKELQARKIDSYIITEGDLANGISLGIFPRSDSAQSVMRRLQDAGYQPGLRELPRAQRSYWVRVEPSARRLADDALPILVTDFKELRHQVIPCESVATTQ